MTTQRQPAGGENIETLVEVRRQGGDGFKLTFVDGSGRKIVWLLVEQVARDLCDELNDLLEGTA